MNLCIVQARMGSTRLPGKVMKKIGDLTLLEYELLRLKRAKKIDQIVIATTVDQLDDELENLCQAAGVDCYRGSVNDVLDRFHQCALNYPDHENIIRVTGDCPLIDAAVVDEVIGLFMREKADYASNINPETFPDGMDVEIFKRSVLAEAASRADKLSEREHVTLFIRNNDNYKKANLTAGKDHSQFRLTVDNPEDLEVVEYLVKNSDITHGYLDLISLLLANEDVLAKNRHIGRNEGLKKSLENDSII